MRLRGALQIFESRIEATPLALCRMMVGARMTCRGFRLQMKSMTSLWTQLRACWRSHISTPLFSRRGRQNPYPHYSELREVAPVHCLKKKGYWAVSRYDDIEQVLSDPDLYRSSDLPGIEGSLLNADDPGHSRVRQVVAKAFSASNVASMEGYIRSVARDCVDKMAGNGQCEFVQDLARPLPAKVVATMLGLDIERLADCRRWTESGIGDEPEKLDTKTKERYARDQQEQDAFIAEHLKKCRSEGGQSIFDTEVISNLSDHEAADVLKFLLVSGHVTTTHLLGNLMVALLQNPDIEKSLRANPELIPAAVEETLRIDSAVQSTLRRPVREVTIAGQTIPANTPVLLLLGSANHAEEKFPAPTRFSLERKGPGHLSFGKGVHYCLGARLGRLEAKVVLETLLERLEVIESAEPLDGIEWDMNNTQMRGPSRLKLNVRPFPRS
jgi:cytochrome P450